VKQRSIYKTPAGQQAVMALYDRILAQWPGSTERLWIETRFGRTHVLAQGPKEACPLVLLHGAGANALAWGADVPEFARHFRVFAVETPGEPGRSCQERIPWEGAGIVEWLEDVLAGLGADRAAGALAPGPAAQVLLAGVSQGGYIALRFASAHPERVKALALLAPGGVAPVKPGFVARAVFSGLLGRRGSEALARTIMGDGEMHPTAVEFMELVFTHFRSRMDALPLLTDADLRRLIMPVLLMVGAKDKLFDGVKIAARFRRLVQEADVRLLPDAGHTLVAVASEVAPFLAGAAGREAH
jgi:pimeloyl-ACP methyl ester carboxylesterase